MQLPLMRRLVPGFSAAVIVLLAPVIAAETMFHVAPGGNDANPGGPDAPFASLPHAVSAARGADAATIVVHDGTYSLEAPLELTAADSGLTIRAAEAEKPIKKVIRGCMASTHPRIFLSTGYQSSGGGPMQKPSSVGGSTSGHG